MPWRFAFQRPFVKGGKSAGLHIVEASHSFVDVPHGKRAAAPHRTGTTAQRIRIGLTGLAFAFLLVLLGSIVSHSGRDQNVAASSNQVTNKADEPKEPLAELGVAPGAETGDSDQNNSATP